ncbi:uncharacterized protein LOC125681150 isoform X2 [Ostrea edulis]|uniref:uncharacterized protein LOC125681150 isoform X2 n=1 Tax=Ostrea edulis TaxID=37623 RepID=UPI0024AF0930|nr:uncharacterized protein LOC125681150 isoform X2 [Ostrea edulis]
MVLLSLIIVYGVLFNTFECAPTAADYLYNFWRPGEKMITVRELMDKPAVAQNTDIGQLKVRNGRSTLELPPKEEDHY